MPVDLSNAWKSGSRILNTAISLVPNIILALVVFILFLFIASTAKAAVRRFSQQRHRRRSLGVLLGQLAHVAVVTIGFLIALSMVAPSFHAVDLIRILGIGSVAIGFAFQNILQNFLAGILLLIQEPFEIGDWISITGFEGQVEDIQTRATEISTANGQRIVIPNAVLFTNPVVVGHARAAGERTSSTQAVAQAAGQSS
ncbi:MAG: mechanosensitive ion channel domain-containing protein [Candidatus Acidiferrales bacterium]